MEKTSTSKVCQYRKGFFLSMIALFVFYACMFVNNTPVSHINPMPMKKALLTKEAPSMIRKVPVTQESPSSVNFMSIEEVITKRNLNKLTARLFLQPFKLDARIKQRTDIKLYNSCAVVGSSGILLHSGCGNEISSHDLIIRLNMAKYKGYEKDVGNRTDLSGINYVKCNQVLQCFSKQKKKCPAYKELLALRKSIILLTVFTDGLKTKARFRRHMAFVDMLYKSGIKFDIRVSAEGATAAIKMFWKLSKMPTAGIRGIAIALTMCRSVSAYGFYTSTVSPSGKPVPYHYFDHMKLGGYRSHNFSEEQVVLSELNRNQVIRMVTDRCN